MQLVPQSTVVMNNIVGKTAMYLQFARKKQNVVIVESVVFISTEADHEVHDRHKHGGLRQDVGHFFEKEAHRLYTINMLITHVTGG
jgi:hypothetical protein